MGDQEDAGGGISYWPVQYRSLPRLHLRFALGVSRREELIVSQCMSVQAANVE